MPIFRFSLLVVAMMFLASCAEIELASHVTKNAIGGQSSSGAPTQKGTFKVGKPYNISGTTYYPRESYDHVETGIASWYGPGFHGKKTASGEQFDTGELTAAHRTLQMPSLVRVTNLENGRSVIVRVNDRGPFARGRVIDVSQKAAELLDFKNKGTAKVRLEVLPQESLQIAEMAKRGESTRGIEIAANQGRMPAPPSVPASSSIPPPGTVSGPPPVNSAYETASYDGGAVMSDPLPGPSIPGHTSADGYFLPDPVVTQRNVEPTNIYIQAGSFSVYDNAQNLSQSLQSIGATSIQNATVNGQQFYRVRVGPAPNVGAADRLLAQVVAMGHNSAIIVVD